MNEPAPYLSDVAERLLREHLDRQAERLDMRLLYERVQATLAAEQPIGAATSPRRPLSRWRWAAACAVAACLLVTGFLFWQADQTSRASPQSLLQETQKTFLQPVYRCYLVEIQRETGRTDDMNSLAALAGQTLLWTRGDRFWIETTFPARPGRRTSWGRDEQGTIWMLSGPREGVLIAPSETPRWLTVYCDLCSMQPDRLIAEVLRDFDLHRDEAIGSSIYAIRTAPKPGGEMKSLRSALLELDAETKVLRHVVLNRVVGGYDQTTTFTLLETKTQDEVHYPLDGTEGKREFYSTDFKPDERKNLLIAMFGQRAAEWLKPPLK